MRPRLMEALVASAVLAMSACAGGAPAADPPTTTSTAVDATAPPSDPTSPSTDVSGTTGPTTVPAVSTDPAVTDPSAPITTAPTTTAAPTTTTTAPAPPPPNGSFADVRLGLELVADVDLPTAIAWRSGDQSMYVTTQDGLVLRVLDGVTSIVLDLTDQVTGYAPGSERGLLGIAFDPRDGRMYLDYTDLDNDTHVVSYRLDGGIALPSSRRQVLFIEQPGLGHNGGRLLFDDAGNLYIGSGDGGGSNGRDAQDTTKLFGVIMRITPSLDGDGYGIPADNPFADGVADRPEVWARGFRNPWTFSLDRATGDLWIGDVGNETMEEIDVMRGGERGLNFGWYWFEGTRQRRDGAPEGLIPPVHAYPRSEGVAVMGGHVYRGSAIPELRGAYLFGDLGGPLRAIGADGVSRLDAEQVKTLVGWGEDPAGELYLLSLRDGVYRLVRRP